MGIELTGTPSDTYTPAARYRSGLYYGPEGRGTTTLLVANQQVRYVPLRVESTISIDRIGIEVTVAGSAGSLVRLGIFNSTDGAPSSRLLDAGTVAADTTGAKEVTVAQALTPDVYWLVAVAQSATPTAPTLRCINGADAPMGHVSLASATSADFAAYVDADAVAGALPATANPTTSPGTVGPHVMVRIA